MMMANAQITRSVESSSFLMQSNSIQIQNAKTTMVNNVGIMGRQKWAYSKIVLGFMSAGDFHSIPRF